MTDRRLARPIFRSTVRMVPTENDRSGAKVETGQSAARASERGVEYSMTENCMEDRGGDSGIFREPDDVLNRIAVLSRTFLWQVDTSGIYTFVSDAVESILGYRPEELVGAVHFYDLHPDDGRDEFRETAFGAFSRKEPFRSVQRAIADAMAISATLAGVVKVIRRELGELMDARNFLIAEYDDSTKTLFAQPSLSSDEKELLTRWSGEKSLTGMVIRNRHAMRFSKEEIRWLADEGAIDLVGARAEAWIGVAWSRRSTRYMLFPSRAVICFV